MEVSLIGAFPKRKNLPANRWFSDNGNLRIKPLADHIDEVLDIIALRDTGELYVYEGGKYHSGAETNLEELVNWIVGDGVKKRHRREVIDALRTENYVSRSELNKPEKFINLENGLLDLETFELESHSPEYYFTRQSSVKYDSDAEPEQFKDLVSEMVKEEDVERVQEMFGYALMNEQKLQKAFMLVGGGSNGKSTLLKVLEKLLGEEAISNVTLHDLENNRFASAQLFEKKANIAPDIPGGKLKETSQFKSLTGGDRVFAEKKHKSGFMFENKATLIFAANSVPESYDDTEAFYRRWMIIDFPYKFTDDPEDGHKQKNPDIVEGIIEDQGELSGILNWALKGMKRLKSKGCFPSERSNENTEQKYKSMSNSVQAFVQEKVEEGRLERPDSDFVLKKEAYSRYKSLCDENDLDVRPYNYFCKVVKQEFRVKDFRPKIDGEQKSAWRGIKLKGLEDIEGW